MFKIFSQFKEVLRYPILFGVSAVQLVCVAVIPVASAQEVPPLVINLQTGEQIELTRAYWNANVDIADRPVVCDHFVFNAESAVYEMPPGNAAGWPGGFYLSNGRETFTHDPLIRDAEGNASRGNVHHAYLPQFRGQGASWTVQNGIYQGITAFAAKEYLELVSYDSTNTEVTKGSTNNAIRVWHSEDDVSSPTYSVCFALDGRPFIPTGSAAIANSDLPALDELNEFTFQFPEPIDAGATVPVINRLDTGEQVLFARGEWAYNEQIALTYMSCYFYGWNEGYQGYVPVPEFGYFVGERRVYSTLFSAYFDNGLISTNEFWTTDLDAFFYQERIPAENFELFSGELYMELTDYGFNIWRPQLSTGQYQRCTFPPPKRTLTLQQDKCDYSNADQYDGWGWNAATQQGCSPEDNLDNVMDEESTDEQLTDIGMSSVELDDVDNNTSVDNDANGTVEQPNNGNNVQVETDIPETVSEITGNDSTSTDNTEDQSNDVDNTPVQTSGAGAADKFLLLFLLCFFARRSTWLENRKNYFVVNIRKG